MENGDNFTNMQPVLPRRRRAVAAAAMAKAMDTALPADPAPLARHAMPVTGGPAMTAESLQTPRQRAGQRAAAVADPGLKAVALLGTAAQTEVDHRTDGAEGADLVETHVEGLSPRSHVAQVPHDLIERVDVDGGRRQQGDVRRNDLGQRISSGLPHRPHLGGVVGGQGDGHTDDALVRVWCGDLHDSWAPTG